MELLFSTALASEAEEVAGLVNSGYRGEASRKGWTTEDHLLGGQRIDAERLCEMISEPDTRLELMRESLSHRLLGCVYLKRETPEVCYLGMLTVDPELQARGLGKRLLEYSEGVALHWGCQRMRMVVIHLRPELIAYYERRGYRYQGVSSPFPEIDPRLGFPKVVDLRLNELIKPLISKPVNKIL